MSTFNPDTDCQMCELPVDPDDAHTWHAEDCPVITTDGEPAPPACFGQLVDAYAYCVCPPEAVCHPNCCPLCKQQGLPPKVDGDVTVSRAALHTVLNMVAECIEDQADEEVAALTVLAEASGWRDDI